MKTRKQKLLFYSRMRGVSNSDPNNRIKNLKKTIEDMEGAEGYESVLLAYKKQLRDLLLKKSREENKNGNRL